MKEKKDKLDSLLSDYYKGKSEHYDTQQSKFVRERLACYELREPIESIKRDSSRRKCPSMPELVSILEGTANVMRISDLQVHLRRCRACRRTLKYGTELIRRHKEGKLEKLPKDLSDKISAQLGAFYRKATSRKKK